MKQELNSHSYRYFVARSLFGRLLVLVSAMALAGLLAGFIGSALFETSWLSLVVSWVVCVFAAVLAHIAGEYPRGNEMFAARLGIQMGVRTVLPFGAAMVGTKFIQPPLETAFVFYILAFYLMALVTDVQLQLVRLGVESNESNQNLVDAQ